MSGLVMAAATGGLVVLAAGQVYRAYQDAAAAQAAVKPPRERIFAVKVDTLRPETVTPSIQSYGRIYSWRSLELRSAVAGPLIDVSADFRDGGAVAAGEMLFRIDPARLETALALASSGLDEARADLAEAEAAVELARLEVQAAAAQLDLRRQALERQQNLLDRGAGTQESVEAAGLVAAAADQALLGRRQVLAQNEARVAQARIGVDRAVVALRDAERALAETTVTAPFDGVMSNVAAVLGRLVAPNEKLGDLIDPAAMEVAFRVTNTQFDRLLNDSGALRRADVTLTLQQGRSSRTFAARVDRAGAEVGDGQVGRIIYAQLTDADLTRLRPGDFVTVSIAERPLANVAVIPAAAATPDGRILLVGEDGRLDEVAATLLRQQGDQLIVADVPFGQTYVLARAQQLGPGIKVEVAQKEETLERAAPPEPDTIVLDDDRRARLIAFVEGNETMQAASKEKVLAELAKPEVSREIVEKFEAKLQE